MQHTPTHTDATASGEESTSAPQVVDVDGNAVFRETADRKDALLPGNVAYYEQT